MKNWYRSNSDQLLYGIKKESNVNINRLILTVIYFFVLIWITMPHARAQVGINENNTNPDASSMLDVSSTDKGLLIPRMNSTNRQNINNPATGLMVFDTTTNSFWYYTTAWQEIGKGAFTSQNGVTFSVNQADDFIVGADSLNHGSGDENKLFFDKEKGAFRAGRISNTNWNNDSLGQFSFAGGNNSRASEAYTFAFGSSVVANGNYATAFGQNTTASGQYATALGVGSIASGNYTLAGGLGVDATETFSIAFGNNIEVNGSASAAFGNFHKLEGSSVFAAGQGHIIKNGWSTALGLSNKTNGTNATAIGLFSTANGDYSTAIGSSLTAASFGETVIGLLNTNYTPNDTAAYHADDRLFVIGNGSSFSNRSDALRIYKNGNAELNGKLTIDSAYTFPNVDGLANQFLMTDGNGELTWSSNSTIQDTDGDTKIQVAKDSDDDIIRFDLAGTEYMRLDSGRVEILNTGGSVFIGESAGDNDDFSDNKNIFIGYTAGNQNTTGENNVMIGNIAGTLNTSGSNNAFFGSYAGFRNEMGEYNAFLGANAGERNVNGDYNTYVGTQAGRLNTSGNNNIFIGYQAGANEFGSDKLYIHNNPSRLPLIFGDFAKDSVQINAKLNINGAFNFPTVDGTVNQVLQTDGNGTVTWVNQPTFTDTDQQTIDKLNLNGTTLELSLENDNADDQTLDLATLKDNLGNHTATQNVATNGFYLSNDGDDEGIFINNEGKVGIGTNSPSDLLEITIGTTDSSPQIIISNLAEDEIESISSVWQSYTATISGTLDTISIPRSGFTTSDWTVTIHQGEGTAGAVLGTLTANTDYDFSTSNISQTAGQTYTIAITIASGEFDPYSNADYDGGVSSLGQNRDIAFELSINPIVGGNFTVGENGLVINNYSLPITDGTANQVLQTDGNGTLAWTDYISSTQPMNENGLQYQDSLYAELVDVEQADINGAPFMATAAWQSFTPTVSGQFTRLDLHSSGNNQLSEGNLRIFEGQGTGGMLLYQTTITRINGNWNAFDLTSGNIYLTAGVRYTFAIESTGRLGGNVGPIGSFFLSITDPSVGGVNYSGGRNDLGGSIDYVFRTYYEAVSSFTQPIIEVNPTATDSIMINLNKVDTIFFTDGTHQLTAATDKQTIDTLHLNGTALELSLENDGEVAQVVDLATINTDNQTIDTLNLNGTTLELSLAGDNENKQTIDLATINTDNQAIDKLNLNGTTLEVSLEGDGPVDKTVNLASLNTDNQTLSINNTTLSISGGNSVDLTNLVPIGTIQMWPTSSPPTGWLICNGSNFDASDYQKLNTVLGGNTLPNFNGRFPLGVGDSGTSGSTNHNIGSNGGEEKHTLSINEMPSHNHGAGTLSTAQPYLSQNGSGNQDKRDGGGTKLFEYDSISGNTASVGGGQAHNNMPPFYTINFIIKAK